MAASRAGRPRTEGPRPVCEPPDFPAPIVLGDHYGPEVQTVQLRIARRHRLNPVLHIVQIKSAATTRITVPPYQSIGLNIDDLVPAKGNVIGITGSAFHEVIPHPLELPPQPVFKRLLRSSHGGRVSPMISGYLLQTGHCLLSYTLR